MNVDLKKAWMYSEYSTIYEDIYRMDERGMSKYGLTEEIADEYVKKYDQLMDKDGNFKELAIDFMKNRGDNITSDREAAAFAVMYEKSLPFLCLREANQEYYEDLESNKSNPLFAFSAQMTETASSQIDKAFTYCSLQHSKDQIKCSETRAAWNLLKLGSLLVSYEDYAAEVRNETDKERQAEIIAKMNPCADEQHTWVRSAYDIKPFEDMEVFGSVASMGLQDFDVDKAIKAFETGEITVYSSKPIKLGGFVTPSEQQARDYAGASGKIYQKTVSTKDIAWLDAAQGQYACIDEFKEYQQRMMDKWQEFEEAMSSGNVDVELYDVNGKARTGFDIINYETKEVYVSSDIVSDEKEENYIDYIETAVNKIHDRVQTVCNSLDNSFRCEMNKNIENGIRELDECMQSKMEMLKEKERSDRER